MKTKPNPKISKLIVAIILIVSCVVTVFTTRIFFGQKTFVAQKAVASRSKGDPKAPIHIVEYLDFECPACARGSKLLKDYYEKYPSKFYLEVHYYPIPRIHDHALQSALYAECAARQGKFWPFEELLIEKQSQWSRMLNAESVFREIASNVNLDPVKLSACVNDDNVKTMIFREKSEGKSRGVDSTPTYFINGKMVVGPNPLTDELSVLLGGKSH